MATALDEGLAEVCRFLRESAGFEPDALGMQSVAHAVRQRMAEAGAESSRDYLRRLQTEAGELQDLLDQVVVPETWFFRDRAAFECVERRLGQLRSQGGGVVRAVSTACSTGEEVYSLAMILRDAGMGAAQLQILGTDLSRKSLEFARQASYSARSFREADERSLALRDRWCERVGESWRVRDELRAGVDFRWGNLAQPDFLAGEPEFQVVFCRNVLIYLHASARRVALRNLRRLLAAEGLLCSAPVEARILSEAGFRSLNGEYASAFQAPDAAPAASPREVPVSCSASKRPPVPVGPLARPIAVARRQLREAVSDAGAARDATTTVAPVLAAGAAAEQTLEPDLVRAAQQAADDGRLDVADTLCRQLLAQYPASAEAFYLSGVVCQARGAVWEARQCFEKALYLAPQHYQALVHLMLLAEQRGDGELAANYRRRAARNAPGDAE